jgi:ParB family transcriptional regulator, chromosome partitioning protein
MPPKKRFQPLTFSTSPEDAFLSVENQSGGKPWADAQELQVETDLIHAPKVQFRLYHDPEKIATLVATIQGVGGIKEPLLLRPHPTIVDGFELIAGSDRLMAARQIGLKTVPAKVDDVDDVAAIKICFIENRARSDPNPYEYARYLLVLLQRLLEQDQEEIFDQLQRMYNLAKRNEDFLAIDSAQEIITTCEQVGINWRSFVSNQMPLLKSIKPDVRDALEQGGIAYTKALLLNRVQDDEVRAELLDKTLMQDLSVEQIKLKIPSRSTSPDHPIDIKRRVSIALKSLSKSKDPAVLKRLEAIAIELEELSSQ